MPAYKAVDVRALCLASAGNNGVFSPHLASYDAVLFIPVAIYLLEWRSSPFLRVSIVAAYGLMWMAPLLHVLTTSTPLATEPSLMPLGLHCRLLRFGGPR